MEHTQKPHTIWILIGGCLLAFLIAAVNAGLFFEVGNSVAQMSGEVTRLSWAMLEENRALLGQNVTLAVLAFLAGATLAGYTLHHPTLDRRLPYGRCLMFIGACLWVAHALLPQWPRGALACGGFAAGFQNALATHYRGIILRTTHITGLLTDIGSHLGMMLRGHRIARWKIGVPAAVILFFFAGGLVGAWLFQLGHAYLLWLGGVYVVSGASWFIIQRVVLKIDHISRPAAAWRSDE